MRRLLSALSLALLAACAASTERSDDDAQPIAGQCPHDFILQHADGVLTDVGVEHVYWGPWWQSDDGRRARATHDASWALLANDARFYAALQAYAPSGTTIRGRYLGSAAIELDAATPPMIDKDVFEAALAKAITDGTLPHMTGDTVPIQVVHMPIDTLGPELDGPGGPIDYAAYHHWITLPSGEQVPYAVVLYDIAENLDNAESHELFEAITNPFSRGWRDRYKDAGGQYAEVADVCANGHATLDDRRVQQVWSPGRCACVAPFTAP